MIEIMVELDNAIFKALYEKAKNKEISVNELIPKMLEVYLEGEGYTRYLMY